MLPGVTASAGSGWLVPPGPGPMGSSASPERRLRERAHRYLDGTDRWGFRARLTEFCVFALKQAWACLFGASLLAVILSARLWYPEQAALARNDFLTIAAVALQVVMIAAGLETLRELRVVLLFHLVGTGMELFKTSVGSWSYEADGLLRLGPVPLFSGFMYAAVGSYMVRVYRIFDLRFAGYPRRWVTAILAAAIYANFFSHHYLPDARWLLLVGVAAVYGPCRMHFRVYRREFRMPLMVAFLLVAVVIWIAENIATWSGAWLYPSQLDGWQPVSLSKLVSWYLLMIISVVLVAWVYRPSPPAEPRPVPGTVADEEDRRLSAPGV